MDWKIGKYDAKLAADLGSYLGVSPILASLLLERGFSDPIRAEMFLKPKLTNLGDPFRVKNLRAAALRLIEAISKKQKVLVFGDYDVDGITSTTLFVNAMRHFGLSPSYFVPRRMDEGYGLSEAALERAFADEKPDLLVALDCGTNAMDAIRYIRSRGIDLIVVDHHQSKDDPSNEDYILVNPHVFDLSTAPWRNLCTVGLVFKLVHALLKEMRLRDDPRSWTLDLKDSLDLVSLGTIADLVPLVDENRILARYGIKRLKTTKRKGIQALIQASGISLGDEITPVDISFRLGPRINASGRLADASLPLDMLLGDDFTTCFRAACELNDINKERQEIERGVFEAAMKKIEELKLAEDPCIIVFDKTWHPGVVGIIAGKLSREFNRPVIVFGETDSGYTKGSGRSIAGLDRVECL
ncbi:MAG: single-stranded-DNA-specific exonuclease RecJ, partial [Opitutales bacterium]|nr:single-stranded-DNA-specific exonuclease RecJ [Opitutales bacterium]